MSTGDQILCCRLNDRDGGIFGDISSTALGVRAAVMPLSMKECQIYELRCMLPSNPKVSSRMRKYKIETSLPLV